MRPVRQDSESERCLSQLNSSGAPTLFSEGAALATSSKCRYVKVFVCELEVAAIVDSEIDLSDTFCDIRFGSLDLILIQMVSTHLIGEQLYFDELNVRS